MIRLRVIVSALALAAAGGASCAASAQGVAAAGAPPPASASDADALMTAMRRVASNPRDLAALIVAGELSLKVGDASGAASLLRRAEQIDPQNARVKAGMARLLVTQERPGEALRYFDQAAGYGLDPRTFAADRGLAYDLLGEQERAQRDYRLALKSMNGDGAGGDEIRRRYALSLGIGGRREPALAEIDPLIRRSDHAAWRVRAFILAMTGDVAGANTVATTMLPAGMGQAMQPFFAMLPRLSSADRAFAVHFGEVRVTPQRLADARLAPVFPALGPDPDARVAVAAATPVSTAPPRESRRSRRRTERLAAATASTSTGRRDARERPVVVASTAPVAATRVVTPTTAAPASVQVARAEPQPAVPRQPAGPPSPEPSRPPVQFASNGVAGPSYQRVEQRVTPSRPAPRPAADAGPPAAATGTSSTPAMGGPAPATRTTMAASSPSEAGRIAAAILTAAAAESAATQPATSGTPGATSVQPTGPGAQSPASVAIARTPPVPTATAGAPPAPVTQVVAGPPAPPTSGTAPVPMPGFGENAAPVSLADLAVPAVPRPAGPPSTPPVSTAATPAVAAVAAATPPATGSDTDLARIIAGLSIPGEELGVVPPPVRETIVPAAPVTVAAVAAPDTAALARAAAERDAETRRAAAEKKAADAKALVEKRAAAKALAARKAADEEKALAAKKVADERALAAKKAAEEKRIARTDPARVWVQVSGGAHEGDLPKAWRAVQAKAPALAGRQGWSTPLRATNRVVTGPFKTDAEAQAFVNQLGRQGVSAFTFTSTAGQKMTRLPAK